MARALILGIALGGVWLLWSGHFTSLLVGLGFASTVGVVLLARRMGVVDREGVPADLAGRMLLYLPWLLWEIFKANVDVALRVLRPSLPISPRVVRVRAGQATDLGRVIYANSITLTPGTVSISVDGDVITVHALSREAADGLTAGAMDRRVQRVDRTGGA
jgi:multicomponent Na+:H+ antiporter subunit E